MTTTTRRPGTAADGGVTGGTRLRVLLAAAFGPLVTGYAVVAALLAVVSALAPNSHFSPVGVLWAAGPGWLVAHQVPIEIDGAPLGVLPLLPTVAACVLVACTAAGAALRLGYRTPAQAGVLAGLMSAGHALPGGVVAVLTSGTVLGVNPLDAVCIPALLAGGSAVVGVAGRCGLVATARHRLDPLALHGLRAGALGMVALLAAAAVTLGIAAVLRAETVNALFDGRAQAVGAGAGMLLLSLGYLPNAAGMALGFTTGPGFSIGKVSVSPFAFTGGDVPGVPLLALIPQEQAYWWPVFLLLPLAAGTLVGWSVRRIHDDPVTRLRVVGVAGALVGFGTVIVSTLVGGPLGSGDFDPVSVSPGFASIAAFLWIAVPGGLVAWFAGSRRRPTSPTHADEQDADEPEETEEPEALETVEEPEEPEDVEEPEEPEEAEEPEEVEEAGEVEEPDESAESGEPAESSEPAKDAAD